MISRKDIQATCDDIVREFAPLQVILFGSYAYGTPTEDSDVDLLVVMDIPESETRRHAVDIRQRIPRRFPRFLTMRWTFATPESQQLPKMLSMQHRSAPRCVKLSDPN